MPVIERTYDLPDEDELAQLVGAATPHFAFQILARVEAYLQALPPDHARVPELQRHVEALRRLGLEGETAGLQRADLPPSRSLSSGLKPPE